MRLKIFITLTIKMSQTFLMLNLYTLLKLQLLTIKFPHCLQSYFLYTDQWSVLSKWMQNTQITYSTPKLSFGPIKVHLIFNTVIFTSTLVPSKRCWWGYGDGCSSISWAFMGGLTQDFLLTIYYIHDINYFEVQRRGNRIKFGGLMHMKRLLN